MKRTNNVNGLIESNNTVSHVKKEANQTASTTVGRGVPDANWSQIEAAQFYATELGWRVLPVRPNKTPYIGDWPRGATTDPEKIAKWWSEYPDALIGIVGGPASGVAIVDLDNKAGGGDGLTGVERFERLEAENTRCSGVPTSRTPSGGSHKFFDGNSLPFAKSEGAIGTNIDLRSSKTGGGSSGYAIVPPSKVPGVGSYEWEDSVTLQSLLELPTAPHWLAERAFLGDAELLKLRKDEGLRNQIRGTKDRSKWDGIRDEYRAKQLKSSPKANASVPSGQDFMLDDPYISKSISNELQTVSDCTSDQNSQLNRSSFQVGSLLSGTGIASPDDVGDEESVVNKFEEQLFEAAMQMVDTDPNNPWSSKEGQDGARKTIKSGLKSGLENPRDMSGVNHTRQASNKFNSVAGALAIKPMSAFELKPLEFLWKPFLPKGKISIVAGNPGLGKSQLTIDIAARVSTGDGFPNPDFGNTLGRRPEFLEPRKPGSVLLVTCEDDPGDTIRPRLEAAKANIEHVHLIEGQKEILDDGTEAITPFSLSASLKQLDAVISELGDVELLIVDPVSAYMGNANAFKNSDVRAVLAPLSELAAKHGIAVLLVTHLNKQSSNPANSGNVLSAVMDSLGFTAVARSVMLVTKDPNDDTDPDKRLMLPAKNNLAKAPNGLEFFVTDATLQGGYPTSCIEWGEMTKTTAGEALGAVVEGQSAIEDAIEFLSEALYPDAVKSEDLKKLAKQSEIKLATLRRAKEKLGIKSEHVGGGTNGYWQWSLPQKSQD